MRTRLSKVRGVRKQRGELEVRNSAAGVFGRDCFSFCEVLGEEERVKLF
jgi:hypothetical protein